MTSRIAGDAEVRRPPPRAARSAARGRPRPGPPTTGPRWPRPCPPPQSPLMPPSARYPVVRPSGCDAHAVDARAAGDADRPSAAPPERRRCRPGRPAARRTCRWRRRVLSLHPRARSAAASRSSSSGRSALATQAEMCRAASCPAVPACCWTWSMSVASPSSHGSTSASSAPVAPAARGRCRAARRPRPPAPRRSCCSRRRRRGRRDGQACTAGPGQVARRSRRSAGRRAARPARTGRPAGGRAARPRPGPGRRAARRPAPVPRRPTRARPGRASSGSSGATGTGSAPAVPITAGTSMTASSARNGSVPWLRRFTTWTSPVPAVSEASSATAASE